MAARRVAVTHSTPSTRPPTLTSQPLEKQPKSHVALPQTNEGTYTDGEQLMIKKVSYHWVATDDAVLNDPPMRLRPLHVSARSASGMLALLPVKVLDRILLDLDLKTLEAIRRVDARTRTVVDTLPQYRDITSIASTAFQALSATILSMPRTLRDLYTILCNDRCEECGEYGSLLFMLNCTRCCWKCLDEEKSRPNLTVKFASEETYKPIRHLPFPVARAVSGRYGLKQHDLTILRQADASSLLIGTYRLDRGVLVRVPEPISSPSHRYSGLFRGPGVTPEMNRDWLSVKDRIPRYMATTPFPSLDPHTREVQRGVWCRGCEQSLNYELNPPRYDRQSSHILEKRSRCYSKREFLTHFETCEGAQRLWMRVKEGVELHRIQSFDGWRRDGG